VNSLEDALADAQVAHLHLAKRVGAREWEVALPVELQGVVATGRAPRAGEHTDDLLDALGYSRAEADQLRALNAVA
jgi:crotonobetainyl-CoA:carnitine CoA-transferase CaiB-like acyl-CoA transferase